MAAAFAGSLASAAILFVFIERPYSLAKTGAVDGRLNLAIGVGSR
jgi:hypothetical protein